LTGAAPARIKVDLDRRIGAVDPRLYGGFIEHLGRCIYGGIFDEASPLSDARGFRRDVLQALSDLRMTVLRWPGGLFANGYHWEDGIGPRGSRPRRTDVAWGQEESNRFGTDEFVQYCRAVGSEPAICINMGSGTISAAQAWVEYCNGTGDTHWANLRRRNGSPEPHGVKYWALGNEMYGRDSIGALNAEDYVKKAIEFANVMKRTDPSIQLIGCGMNGWSRWDRVVIEGLASVVDFHSIHIYSGSDDYYSNVFAPHQAERALTACQGLITAVRYQQGIRHPIHVAYDEWNVWYRSGNPPWPMGSGVSSADGLEEQYTLADALAVATYFNVFIRYCRTVRMANLAQMVNVLAPIVTSQTGLVLQTSYHVFQLYSTLMRGEAVDVHVEGSAHTLLPADETSRWPHRVADLGPFTVLDAVAVVDEAGNRVSLAVVNRNLSQDILASVVIPGFGDSCAGVAYEINGGGVDSANTVDHPEAVTVAQRAVASCGPSLEYRFPAHSLALLVLNARD
jgi:alpha-N-arabinofuranosidase